MNIFKKLLASLGLAASMAAPMPATAGVTLQFYDDAGLLLYEVARSGAATTINTFDVIINGWRVGFSIGQVFVPSLVSMTLSGSAWYTGEASSLLGNDYSTNCNFGICGLNGTGTSVNTADKKALKIRFISDSFPNAINPTSYTLSDSLASTNTAITTVGNGLMSVSIDTTSPGTLTPNAGPPGNKSADKFYAKGTGENFTYEFNATQTPFMTVQAGVDLRLPVDNTGGFGTQDFVNRFDFVNTIQRQLVPEPGTLALIGLGLVGVAALRRRKVAA